MQKTVYWIIYTDEDGLFDIISVYNTRYDAEKDLKNFSLLRPDMAHGFSIIKVENA